MHVHVPLAGTDLGRSGIGTYTVEVIRGLAAAERRGELRLSVSGTDLELNAFSGVLAGVSACRYSSLLNSPGLSAAHQLLWAPWEAAARGADVVLLPSGNRRFMPAMRAASVAVVHDLAQLHVSGKYDALRTLYVTRLLVPALAFASAVVTPSEATRRDLLDVSPGLAARTVVVKNGVNTERFSPTVDLRTTPSGRPYLLYVARLEHPGKNHIRLLRAFAASGLAASHDLTLAGPDWGGEALVRSTIAELGLASSVRMLGWVADDELPTLVRGADAVLALGLHEGFGLPAIEALAAGRPVLVSGTGALPEVVGELGVVVDPLSEVSIAEGLKRVLFDEPLRVAAGLLGPARAGRQTWERTVAQLIGVCRSVVEARVVAPRWRYS